MSDDFIFLIAHSQKRIKIKQAEKPPTTKPFCFIILMNGAREWGLANTLSLGQEYSGGLQFQHNLLHRGVRTWQVILNSLSLRFLICKVTITIAIPSLGFCDAYII